MDMRSTQREKKMGDDVYIKGQHNPITKLGSIIANQAAIAATNDLIMPSKLTGPKREVSGKGRNEKKYVKVDSDWELFQMELKQRRKALSDRAEEKERAKTSATWETETRVDETHDPKPVENVVLRKTSAGENKRIIGSSNNSNTSLVVQKDSDFISNPRLTVKERIAQTNVWANINANNPNPITPNSECSTTIVPSTTRDIVVSTHIEVKMEESGSALDDNNNAQNSREESAFAESPRGATLSTVSNGSTDHSAMSLDELYSAFQAYKETLSHTSHALTNGTLSSEIPSESMSKNEIVPITVGDPIIAITNESTLTAASEIL
jgi:hypothetical protein